MPIDAQTTLHGKLERKAEIDTLLNFNNPQPNSEGNLNPLFEPKAIKLKGFQKGVNERSESFIATNNTSHHISKISILIRYLDMKNNVIHERNISVGCDIPSGATRQLSILSFDKQKAYYYYLGAKPKRVATPFKVAYQLLCYDIRVHPQN